MASHVMDSVLVKLANVHVHLEGLEAGVKFLLMRAMGKIVAKMVVVIMVYVSAMEAGQANNVIFYLMLAMEKIVVETVFVLMEYALVEMVGLVWIVRLRLNYVHQVNVITMEYVQTVNANVPMAILDLLV